MGKMGEDYQLTEDFQRTLKLLQNRRGMQLVSITWVGRNKSHMKWSVRCTNPDVVEEALGDPTIMEFGPTPFEALKKICKRLRLPV